MMMEKLADRTIESIRKNLNYLDVVPVAVEKRKLVYLTREQRGFGYSQNLEIALSPHSYMCTYTIFDNVRKTG